MVISNTIRFFVFILLFVLTLGSLIYWREYDVREQVSYLKVVLWQFYIWAPWILFYIVFEKIDYRYIQKKSIVFSIGVLWLVVHFFWFFYLSANYSPYLGLPATGYGVYPYFFIFWIFIDVVLYWNLIKMTQLKKPKISNDKEFKIELTRGGKKFYCDAKQIFWISAEDYYIKFHTSQGAFLSRKSMKELTQKLPTSTFMRIHRSTIINFDFVSSLESSKNNVLEVVLKDGIRRRVSRNYQAELRKIFKDRSI